LIFFKFGCTLLYTEANAWHPEICELLIEEGVYVDATDKTGQTTFMHPVINNYKQVALLLERHGADVEENLTRHLSESKQLNKYQALSAPMLKINTMTGAR